MPEFDSKNTTDPSAIQPTPAEMEAMWFAARLQDADEIRAMERTRAALMAGIYGEAA
jgi:hypothetical protein